MDKKKLNNEIICCRAAVRKARVAVIRKIIKKMKILKTCKLEAVKEKKLRKSERLFEKVQIMKKVKDDEVTKFALRNKDLEMLLKGPQLDLKLNALASLAKHDAVVKKVNSIKEQFSDWEKELPILLDSLEKKRREVVNGKKSTSKDVGTKKEVGKVKKIEATMKSNPKKKPVKKMLQKYKLWNESEGQTDENESGTEDILHTSERVDKPEKIEDPFFIEKKVIAPKLLLESLSSKKGDEAEFPRKSLWKRDNSQLIRGKAFKIKKDISKIKTQKLVDGTEEEKLHPSWAAKKVKLIKPFQGKKIMFSDD